MKDNKYPLKLAPVLKSVLWGGDRLCTEWGKQAQPNDHIGESWELSVRERENTLVTNGPFSGMTLGACLTRLGSGAVSDRLEEQAFPLLVKLIDAHDRLSVQIHPDDDYAARIESDRGKSELWYIIEAEEDAAIVYGLKKGIDANTFRALTAAGRCEEGLCFQQVHPGETYFIPAGLIHAIGKGILFAEIQQNSDLTYRVYDYDRRTLDGQLRPLHTKKALEVLRPWKEEEIHQQRYAKLNGTPAPSLLAHCRYFRVEKLTPTRNTPVTRTVTPSSFHSLLALRGEAILWQDGISYKIKKGDSYFLPAGMGSYYIESAEAELLLSSLS